MEDDRGNPGRIEDMRDLARRLVAQHHGLPVAAVTREFMERVLAEYGPAAPGTAEPVDPGKAIALAELNRI